jgi:hypothetical protein
MAYKIRKVATQMRSAVSFWNRWFQSFLELVTARKIATAAITEAVRAPRHHFGATKFFEFPTHRARSNPFSTGAGLACRMRTEIPAASAEQAAPNTAA